MIQARARAEVRRHCLSRRPGTYGVVARCLVLATITAMPVCAAIASQSDCGDVALSTLLSLRGVAYPEDGHASSPGETRCGSLGDIKRRAALAGVQMVGVKGGWEDVLAVTGPIVVGLVDPAHLTVVIDSDESGVICREGGALIVLPQVQFSRRFCGVALIPVSDAEEGPRLDVSAWVTEAVCNGSSAVCTIELRNSGRSPLFLDVTGTSCSCTDAELSVKEIAPGGTARLTMEHRRRGPQPAVETVWLSTNDPWARSLPMKIRIPGDGVATARPRELLFRSIDGPAAPQQLVIEDPEDLVVQSVVPASPIIHAVLVKRVPLVSGQVAVVIEVAVVGEPASGRYQT